MPKTRHHRCIGCGEFKGDVLYANSPCEECEENYAFCGVCGGWMPSDDSGLCRHLHWCDLAGTLCGSGSDEPAQAKLPLMTVLKHTGLADVLRRAIVEHDYFFQYHGSIFGAEGVCAELLGHDYDRRITDAITDLSLTRHRGPVWDLEFQRFRCGVAWLVSLWCGRTRFGWEAPPILARTPEADALTVTWIDRFLALDGVMPFSPHEVVAVADGKRRAFGRIIQVLEPGERPRGWRLRGRSRARESYLVLTPGGGNRGRVLWMDGANLKRIAGTPAA